MRRRFPPNTTALPYVCGDPTCECAQVESEDLRLGVRAVPHEHEGVWLVDIVLDGFVIDQLRAHTLTLALQSAHREYPAASFDPEV